MDNPKLLTSEEVELIFANMEEQSEEVERIFANVEEQLSDVKFLSGENTAAWLYLRGSIEDDLRKIKSVLRKDVQICKKFWLRNTR